MFVAKSIIGWVQTVSIMSGDKKRAIDRYINVGFVADFVFGSFM